MAQVGQVSIDAVVDYVSEVRARVDEVEVGKAQAYQKLMIGADYKVPSFETTDELAKAFFASHVVKVEPVSMAGLSGAKFFKVIETKDGSVLALLKVFNPERSYECLDEFYSLHAFAKAGVLTPILMGVGRVSDQLVMVEEMIDGETLKSCMKRLIKSSDAERAAAFKEMVEKVHLLGVTLAKFHGAKVKLGTTHSLVRAQITSHVEGCFEELEKADREICDFYGMDKEEFIPLLRAYFEEAQALWDIPVPRSFMHADVNFGNFVQGGDGQLRMLDSWWGAFSVDKDGEPIGVPFFDYVQALIRLDHHRYLCEITDDECDELKRALTRGYKEAGGITPDQTMQDFYTFIDGAVLLKGVTHWFHVGAKDSLGPIARYWMEKLREILPAKEEHAEAM